MINDKYTSRVKFRYYNKRTSRQRVQNKYMKKREIAWILN